MTTQEAPGSPSRKGRVHLPKISSPFMKKKKRPHHKEDGTALDEESDSKDIESYLSDGVTNIKVVVNGNSGEEETPKLAHPSLSSLLIMDVDGDQRIFANAEPVRISNEWFDMDMVVMLRTPNVDDDKAVPGSEWNQKVANYFRPKQRRFEFQYQVKLKKKPDNKELFYAIQWEKPVKMGLLQRAFVTACLAFLRKTRPTVHCTVHGSTPNEEGAYEKPHLANHIEVGLDRVVITKPGETPPDLGGDIVEDLDHYKQRKAGKIKIDFNTEDTYTFALWNANVDWIDWKVVGIPGIKSFDLKSVLGNQSLSILLYMLDKERGNHHHYQKDLHTIVHLEMSCVHKHDHKEKEKKGVLGLW
eukprot:scaffold733_cov97-Cylindrotheca_fusiformis.AAC.2